MKSSFSHFDHLIRFRVLLVVGVCLLLFGRQACHAAPANDNVANAQVIPAGTTFSVTGTYQGATTEAFETASDYPFPYNYTVWYSWTPTVSGFLSTGGQRADGLTLVHAVFRGGAQPGTKTYLVGDDAYSEDTTLSNLHVDAGQSYYFVVGEPYTRMTSFTLSGRVTPEPAFFNGETSLGSGIYSLTFPGGNLFGYYAYLTDARFVYHFDLGYEYVFDSNDGSGGVYLYDFASNDYFYTSPSFAFPYLYDFNLQAFLYYYPDTGNAGHYTSKPRYFYNFSTGKIISK